MPAILVPRSLKRAYARLGREGSPSSFPERALAALEILLRIGGTGLTGIPATGPLVVVANHPFGAADGLALLAMLERVRADVRVVGNAWLANVPELADRCVRVDPDGRRQFVGTNARAIRDTFRWLRGGGCVLIFPAGEVAHRLAAPDVAVDTEWRRTPVVLAERSSAAILPVFVRGANSRWFRLAGRIHPVVRTMLLALELARMRGACLDLTVGEAIPHSELARIDGAGSRLSYVRTRTFLLAADDPGRPPISAPAAPVLAKIAPAGPSEAIAADVAALRPERLLLQNGELKVFCAPATELPAALHEIGRLREIAFRAAGEGSGLARDLDRFDLYYRHLFVWDAGAERIVAAYRVGATDEILARSGAGGLYTRTLFQYDERLFDRLGPALELGRAFVRTECQRDFSPLFLLWKGIGRLVAREPRYRCLFGTVSISNRYESLSRALLVRFLRATRYRDDLAALVTPTRPPRPCRRDAILDGAVVASLDAVSRLVELIERDGKSVPVLLRQYLKLNARVLGFNIDPAFGDVLDGLLLVDFADVEPAILARYMGREDAERFLLTLKRDVACAFTDPPPRSNRAA